MSKVDAQRAMREANYERLRASGPTRREAAAAEGTPTGPSARTPSSQSPKPGKPAAAEAAPQDERCGHKSMNGRACTREAAHPEKNHRYS